MAHSVELENSGYRSKQYLNPNASSSKASTIVNGSFLKSAHLPQAISIPLMEINPKSLENLNNVDPRSKHSPDYASIFVNRSSLLTKNEVHTLTSQSSHVLLENSWDNAKPVCQLTSPKVQAADRKLSLESSDDMFYESSPVLEESDQNEFNFKTEPKARMRQQSSSQMAKNCPIVKVHFKPHMNKPLLQGTDPIDLRKYLKHTVPNLNVYGPLGNMCEFDGQHYNQDAIILNILNDEIELLSMDEHKEPKSFVSFVKGLFTSHVSYFEKYPWAKYFRDGFLDENYNAFSHVDLEPEDVFDLDDIYVSIYGTFSC